MGGQIRAGIYFILSLSLALLARTLSAPGKSNYASMFVIDLRSLSRLLQVTERLKVCTPEKAAACRAPGCYSTRRAAPASGIYLTAKRKTSGNAHDTHQNPAAERNAGE